MDGSQDSTWEMKAAASTTLPANTQQAQGIAVQLVMTTRRTPQEITVRESMATDLQNISRRRFAPADAAVDPSDARNAPGSCHRPMVSVDGPRKSPAYRTPRAIAAETPSANPPPLVEEPDSRIGPYRLLQAIGKGGMGAVCMAELDRPVRRRVVLKVIKPSNHGRRRSSPFAEKTMMDLTPTLR
jgi:hypothetical protein